MRVDDKTPQSQGRVENKVEVDRGVAGSLYLEVDQRGYMEREELRRKGRLRLWRGELKVKVAFEEELLESLPRPRYRRRTRDILPRYPSFHFLVSCSRSGGSNKAVQQDRGVDAADFPLRVEHAVQRPYTVGVEQHLFLNGRSLTAFLTSVFPVDSSPEERMSRVVPQARDLEGD